jgi:hypothetical protein
VFKRFLRSETAVHLLGLTGLWVLFFWRFAASDQATRWVFADGDFTLQFGLFRDLVYRQLVQGHLPLWERCLYAGYPIYADPQTQLFYPPSWLAYIGLKVLGWGHYPIEAFTLEAISHFLLGSWFCYWFLRRSDLPASVALFGAALFTYSGYLTAYPVFTNGNSLYRNLATTDFAPVTGLQPKTAVALVGMGGIVLGYFVYRRPSANIYICVAH